MSESRNIESVAFMFGYMMLSVIFAIVFTYSMSIWLGINVALAIIPFIIINNIFIRFNRNENKFDWLCWILVVVFVLFLPNTFYIITDLIHLNSSDYFSISESGTEYIYHIEAYMFLFHVFVSAIIGTYLGVKSLIKFNDILRIKVTDRYTRSVIFAGVLVLSSTGIYIGRFLRFFSWDVINPLKLLSEVFSSFDLFSITFILMFTGIQYILYYGYKIVFEEEPFK